MRSERGGTVIMIWFSLRSSAHTATERNESFGLTMKTFRRESGPSRSTALMVWVPSVSQRSATGSRWRISVCPERYATACTRSGPLTSSSSAPATNLSPSTCEKAGSAMDRCGGMVNSSGVATQDEQAVTAIGKALDSFTTTGESFGFDRFTLDHHTPSVAGSAVAHIGTITVPPKSAAPPVRQIASDAVRNSRAVFLAICILCHLFVGGPEEWQSAR